MRSLRESSLEEYAAWYLRRDAAKPGRQVTGDRSEDSVAAMRRQHPGKMRDWFDGHARWSVVILDAPSELERLVFLESQWTKNDGLVVPDGSVNYRLLGRVARNASNSNYFENSTASRHREYRDDLRSGRLHLIGDSRIVVCSAEVSERRTNPAGDYYLLDGVGRCLPLMMLLQSGELKFQPVEAFLAQRCS